MAESKRRGEDAVDERLDEGLDEDALRDDASDDIDETASGSTALKSKPTRSGGGEKMPPKPKPGEHPGIFGRMRNFIREVISELGKVIWPTRKELLTYTAVVIVFVSIIMTIVGLLDSGFAWLVFHVFGSGKK